MRDVVLAGPDRDHIGALVFPDIEACRSLPGLGLTPRPMRSSPTTKVRAKFAELLAALATQSQGSSTRVVRLILMAEPPSMDKGEMTDKGSINQRSVLANRAALVEQLYAEPVPEAVIAL